MANPLCRKCPHRTFSCPWGRPRAPLVGASLQPCFLERLLCAGSQLVCRSSPPLCPGSGPSPVGPRKYPFSTFSCDQQWVKNSKLKMLWIRTVKSSCFFLAFHGVMCLMLFWFPRLLLLQLLNISSLSMKPYNSVTKIVRFKFIVNFYVCVYMWTCMWVPIEYGKGYRIP